MTRLVTRLTAKQATEIFATPMKAGWYWSDPAFSALPFGPFPDQAAALADADEHPDADETAPRLGSVVAPLFKARYHERADSLYRKPKDIPAKALRRSSCDWLSMELQRRTLDERAHISIHAFEAILDANGVRHSHWKRSGTGWQGRIRMTGRLALQRVVAENGYLSLPDGSTIPAPKNWIAKHLN